MKKVFVGSVILLFLLNDWAKVKVNPFVPLLPKKKVEKTETTEEMLNIKEIKLEGVILGEERACAVINGDVYKKGDMLKEYGAQIINIDKEGVDLRYNNKIYRIGIKEETETRKEMR